MFSPISAIPDAPPLPRRRSLKGIAAVSVLLLAGCAELTPSAAPRLNAEGAAVYANYPVTTKNITSVRERALNTVNEIRGQAGAAPVSLDPILVRAADRQSASMSRQRRAWAFGDDGSSPVHRAAQAGFQGVLIGELVSETFESEVQAIRTWNSKPELRAILIDPRATRIGLGAFQDEDQKLWWTLSVGQ